MKCLFEREEKEQQNDIFAAVGDRRYIKTNVYLFAVSEYLLSDSYKGSLMYAALSPTSHLVLKAC